jgi:hypothetical protein
MNGHMPTGGYLEQSDGSSWMGMYSLNMLVIALELAIKFHNTVCYLNYLAIAESYDITTDQ